MSGGLRFLSRRAPAGVAAGVLLAALTGATAIAAPPSVAFRGDAHMGRARAAVFFELAGDQVVDFQLNRFDILQMTVRSDGRFSGCNTREESVPCVSGTFNRARSRATGTLRFGEHGRWAWSAGAVGTVSGGGG